jgi:flavin reductase (DIM6/NTAB) family NADH-FMN oxidoreductase RutF
MRNLKLRTGLLSAVASASLAPESAAGGGASGSTPSEGVTEAGGRVAIDPAALRKALSAFPTGVAVVTTAIHGRRAGMTVSSFNSVSLDPPLILWSLSRRAPSFPLFQYSTAFGVHILSEHQIAIARQFSTPLRNKFADVECEAGAGGIPRIKNCSAVLMCKTWRRYDGGDHVIMVGEVCEIEIGKDPPLVFALRDFGRVLCFTRQQDTAAADERGVVA